MITTRRMILQGSLAVGTTALLAACTTTKDGDVTTHSLDVTKVKNYAQAGLNAAATIASVLALNPAFGQFALPIREIATLLQTDLDMFTTAVGDTIEISYNDYNWKTLVDSILTDLDRLLFTVGGTLVAILGDKLGLDQALVGKITLVRDALNTVVAVFKIMVDSFVTTASNSATAMTEAEALGILSVQ